MTLKRHSSSFNTFEIYEIAMFSSFQIRASGGNYPVDVPGANGLNGFNSGGLKP